LAFAKVAPFAIHPFLYSGQLDAGFFYSTETSDLKIPALQPAPELAAKASYTLTILNDAPNTAGASRFVNFLLSAQGRELLKQHGVDVTFEMIDGNQRFLQRVS